MRRRRWSRIRTLLRGEAVELRRERDEARAEVGRLREFAAKVVASTCWGWDFDDLDGGDCQELALKCGVIREVPGGFDPDSHYDESGCLEPGDPWFDLAFDYEAGQGGGV